MTRELRPGDQPLPIPQLEVMGSHRWVIRQLRMHRGLPAALRAATESRLVAREQLGLDRYGTVLAPHNGRDVMQDVWEESVDQVVYLATAVREGLPVRELYDRAVDLMLDVVAFLERTPRR